MEAVRSSGECADSSWLSSGERGGKASERHAPSNVGHGMDACPRLGQENAMVRLRNVLLSRKNMQTLVPERRHEVVSRS